MNLTIRDPRGRFISGKDVRTLRGILTPSGIRFVEGETPRTSPRSALERLAGNPQGTTKDCYCQEHRDERRAAL